MTFSYFSHQCWHYTALSCTWTRWLQHIHNARERDNIWSITSHPSCSGKRKTVPKRKASGFKECERRPPEFRGVVEGKRDASSAVCSQCKIIRFQTYNIFSTEMWSFEFLSKLCVGFVDTLILFKEILPQREKYSQESLVSDLLGISYSAHDSLEDVRALQRLVS